MEEDEDKIVCVAANSRCCECDAQFSVVIRVRQSMVASGPPHCPACGSDLTLSLTENETTELGNDFFGDQEIVEAILEGGQKGDMTANWVRLWQDTRKMIEGLEGLEDSPPLGSP